MRITPEEIIDIKKKINDLKILHERRKELELLWKQKGEIILEETTIDFPDIDDNTLLDYNIKISDLNEVKKLISEGAQSKKAIFYAIQSENEEILKILIDHNVAFNYFTLNPTRFLLTESYIKLLNQVASYAFDRLKEDQSISFDGSTLWHHAAHMFFDESKFSELSTDNINEYDVLGYTPLHYAIRLNNIDFVLYLIKNGADIRIPYQNNAKGSPLYFAIIRGHFEIVKILINHGADLFAPFPGTSNVMAASIESGNLALVQFVFEEFTKIDANLWPPHKEMKQPLALAIESGNPELVKFVLEKFKTENLKKDVYDQTIFHYLAQCYNPEIINIVLNNDQLKDLIEQKDLFGYTPLQTAIDKNNKIFIDLYNKKMGKQDMETPGIKNFPIDQITILNKILFYLKLTNQDQESMPKGGHCNGFEFLYLYYSERNKREEFFNILRKISQWDGSYALLEDNNDLEALSGNYKDLSDLMRNMADNLIWFMQCYLDIELKMINPDQFARQKQYNLVKKVDTPFLLEQNLLCDNNINQEQLVELIEIISRFPKAKFEILGGGHATSLYINADGELEFYDPEQKYEILKFSSPVDLAKFIKEHKYIRLNKILNDELMPILIVSHDTRYKDYYYKENEFPKTQEEVAAHQKKSPNQFSHLHVAILINSLPDVQRLLKNNDIDIINMKDAHGNTAFDLAYQKLELNHNIDLLKEILSSENLNLENDWAAVEILRKIDLSKRKKSSKKTDLEIKNLEELLDLIINHHSIKKMPRLLMSAIRSENLDLVKKLVEKGNSPNEYDSGLLPLDSALGIYNLEIIKILLQHGAKIDYQTEHDTNLITRLKRLDCPSEIRDFFIENHFESILNLNFHELFFTMLTNYRKEEYNSLAKLIEKIDIAQYNDNEEPPLQLATQNNSPELIRLLIDNGANVAAADSKPLINAIQKRMDLEILDLLIKAGARLNAKTPGGNTALHVAVLLKNTDAVRFLLERGADFEIKNLDGKTPLDFSENDQEIKKLFEEMQSKQARPKPFTHSSQHPLQNVESKKSKSSKTKPKSS